MMLYRLFFTNEKADNRFFQYMLGWQPSDGRILVSEKGTAKNKKSGYLYIDVFLDARYFGKQVKVSPGELKKRLGRSVELTVHLLDKKITDLLQKFLPPKAVVSLEKSLPYVLFEKLEETLADTGIRVVREDMSRQREFRICKTFLEQAQIKKACQLTKQLWDWLCLQPLLGQTELEVRGILIAEAMRLGLEEEAFSTIVASGVQSSIPHHTSSDLLITPGPLLVDMGFRWQGYCSDMTRTVRVDEDGALWDTIHGKAQKAGESGRKKSSKFCKISVKKPHEKLFLEFTTICQIVKQAYEAALKRIKVGVPVRALDTVAREVITNAGYGPYFTHSLGHGVGLDVHESPHVTTHSEELLKKGMIITIEPGIYLPGKFGVRWENTIVI